MGAPDWVDVFPIENGDFLLPAMLVYRSVRKNKIHLNQTSLFWGCHLSFQRGATSHNTCRPFKTTLLIRTELQHASRLLPIGSNWICFTLRKRSISLGPRPNGRVWPRLSQHLCVNVKQAEEHDIRRANRWPSCIPERHHPNPSVSIWFQRLMRLMLRSWVLLMIRYFWKIIPTTLP